jgi:hypothetical protein
LEYTKTSGRKDGAEIPVSSQAELKSIGRREKYKVMHLVG